jgi:ABC-type branched-subunit amino acid transport system substrate-binding protein
MNWLKKILGGGKPAPAQVQAVPAVPEPCVSIELRTREGGHGNVDDIAAVCGLPDFVADLHTPFGDRTSTWAAVPASQAWEALAAVLATKHMASGMDEANPQSLEIVLPGNGSILIASGTIRVIPAGGAGA